MNQRFLNLQVEPNKEINECWNCKKTRIIFKDPQKLSKAENQIAIGKLIEETIHIFSNSDSLLCVCNAIAFIWL